MQQLKSTECEDIGSDTLLELLFSPIYNLKSVSAFDLSSDLLGLNCETFCRSIWRSNLQLLQ